MNIQISGGGLTFSGDFRRSTEKHNLFLGYEILANLGTLHIMLCLYLILYQKNKLKLKLSTTSWDGISQPGLGRRVEVISQYIEHLRNTSSDAYSFYMDDDWSYDCQKIF